MLFIDQTELVILLAVCTVSAACFIAALIFLVWAVRNHKRKQKPARELVELVADCNAVKSEFAFGEEFTCDGLVVNAFYNLKPESEILTQFDVLTEEEFARLAEAEAANGLCVIKPNMAEAGRAIVIIRYKGKATYYAITVAEPTQEPVEEVPQEEPVQEEILQEEPAQEEVPQEEPAEPPVREEPAQEVIVQRREPIVIEEESYEGVLRYDKSFMARYIQSSDEVKNWYTTLKNELLSYKKVRARIGWKRESFFFGREIVARFGFRGKTLCMYFPLDPNEFADTKYKIEDVSDLGLYEDTPCMYRLKNERRVRYAIELFALVMERKGGIRIERIAEDYYLPYEGIVELIEKGLAKRIIKKKSDEPIFLQGSAAEVAATIIIPDEEPAEENTPTDDVQSTDAEEAEEDVAPAGEQAEGMLFEEVSPTLAETSVEENPSEESPESAEEAVVTIADEETSAEGQTPIDEVQSTDAGEAEEDVVPAGEQAEGMLFEEVSPTLAETPVEDPSEESPESAEEAVETIADGETPAEQPVEEEPLVEEPVEEPAPEEEEPVIEELSKSEIRDVETYEETEKDEDGIEVVGVMFRRRGRKVYWFDPAGKTWEKGEIALYKSPDNPPQEVIIVDNAKRSPSKLHLPLKPLYKATRRPQPPKKK